ncbi:hypothetical protein EUGRSUZ_C01232 [Eucalyptus grandis]|uniref:Uncharacterized protein n=2 Tax=Eucalyptus grandis TaxID=71139 RepID=A0ACC3LG62_EUCGR|nr:hypothetical protein EUGRSUZ_C01232 [Eucalyptus grandis]
MELFLGVSWSRIKAFCRHSLALASLAPILLLHLGSPDTITAYSTQDNQLGVREKPETVAQVGLVIWILLRCWTYTSLSFLTLSIFLAGFIKYREKAWALKSALHQEADMAISRNDEENTLPEISNSKNILPLRPHKSTFEKSDLPPITIAPPIEVFKITKIELGFMFDALYTKRPIIYTKVDFMLCFLTFVCIVLTFSGFTNVTFTFSVLAIAVIFKLYSDSKLLKLLFSDKAIVWAIKYQHQLPMERLLNFLVQFSLAKQKWSNRLPQFNLLRFCLKPDSRSLITKIVKCCCPEEELEKYRFQAYMEKVPRELQELVLREMKQLSRKLLTQEKKLEIISCVWTKMLCYAAYHCDLDSHAQQLRRGREFITLLWLLLAHKTDRNRQAESWSSKNFMEERLDDLACMLMDSRPEGTNGISRRLTASCNARTICSLSGEKLLCLCRRHLVGNKMLVAMRQMAILLLIWAEMIYYSSLQQSCLSSAHSPLSVKGSIHH